MATRPQRQIVETPTEARPGRTGSVGACPPDRLVRVLLHLSGTRVGYSRAVWEETPKVGSVRRRDEQWSPNAQTRQKGPASRSRISMRRSHPIQIPRASQTTAETESCLYRSRPAARGGRASPVSHQEQGREFRAGRNRGIAESFQLSRPTSDPIWNLDFRLDVHA